LPGDTRRGDDIGLVVDDEDSFSAAAVRSVLRHARARVEPTLDCSEDHLYGDGVLAAPREDDVGVSLTGLHELLVHRAHCCQILLQDFLQRPVTFGHVALDPSHEADVRVGIDEHLHITQRPDTLVHEQKVSPSTTITSAAVIRFGARAPQVRREVVHGFFDRLAPRQRPEVRHEQIEIERLWMIPVDFARRSSIGRWAKLR
jgi:hypothetical protein